MQVFLFLRIMFVNYIVGNMFRAFK